MMHTYTQEQIIWLRLHYAHTERRPLTEQFNRTFGLSLTVRQIAATLKRYGIKTERTGCFVKGGVPHNKGLLGFRVSQATEFKKGHVPHNALPVGARRINVYGYHETKVAGPKLWKMDHVLLWEAQHGPVPRGHCLVFIDGDKNHIEIGNLMLVSRAELAQLNKRRVFS